MLAMFSNGLPQITHVPPQRFTSLTYVNALLFVNAHFMFQPSKVPIMIHSENEANDRKTVAMDVSQ